jgi:transposase InsO family protein
VHFFIISPLSFRAQNNPDHFLMKTEDEVLDRFQEFSAQVGNLVEKKIKVLRLDNGGEYTSHDFSDFCKEAGIKKDSIVP